MNFIFNNYDQVFEEINLTKTEISRDLNSESKKFNLQSKFKNFFF